MGQWARAGGGPAPGVGSESEAGPALSGVSGEKKRTEENKTEGRGGEGRRRRRERERGRDRQSLEGKRKGKITKKHSPAAVE